jgi:predicted phage terminase large subunit-like protein
MGAVALANAYQQGLKVQKQKRYEASLMDFAEYVWPVVEPAIPFVKGWALEAICDHLQAVTDGYIRRLLINVPPGFTKSLMTDVFWPAWEWGPKNKPWLRYMCAAYSNHLTERDNMRCRNVVISDRYKKLWGERFRISNEQFTKIKFANDKTGWKLATSVSGIGTGERADRVIIDDPNNPKDMESEVVRDTVNMWFTEIIPDRLNNQAESAIVVIQQRTHEDDVSGTALSREMGYTHLCIPMYYVPASHVNGYTLEENKAVIQSFVGDLAAEVTEEDFFWEDPRQEDGDLAWPERFSTKSCEELRRDKGPYAWSGQYQQDPEPRGGSIIKREFWQLWKELAFPALEFILASLDAAFTAKEENDASALTVWGIFRDPMGAISSEPSAALWLPRDTVSIAQDIPGNPKIILLHAWQERLEFNELVERVTETCTKGVASSGRPRFAVDRLVIEAKASGQSVGQELYRMFRGSGQMGIDLIDPKMYGDKVARVHAIQHLFADKMIYAPDKAWADMVINQCAIFPRGSHDDLVDSTSQALRYLRDTGFALRRSEHRMDIEDEMKYRSSTAPLYPV